ncbi:hypothetical protein SCBWM1_gp44 [Synechococcus phage S-CBWM1]|uniref:Uncharacterized protein n=1 Tax=Synechococcus phage S-CBWM1 TaxID=2053653 RepID=A0A3G1L3H6_9CAUD|nr:hypothetical protein HOU61_gp153 [Synechococcus phage S-CBWM1]ATW62728.1 hypothetical protein SCBWM1_gp44 [Synechococcus phage S-CBWM1]
MAKFRATCWLGQEGGQQTIEVNATNAGYAEKMMRSVYGAKSVGNLVEVKPERGDSPSSGFGPIIILLVALVAAFPPWVLMVIGGAAGTWIAEKVCRVSIEEAMDNDMVSRFWIIFLIALIGGGIGFVKGTDLQREVNSPVPTIERKAN